jgi:hypothetical protein
MVASCVPVASTKLEKALDAEKEDIGGADTPSAMMGSRLTKSPGQRATIGGQLTPLDVGQPSPTHQSSSVAHDRGSRPVHALSPHPTIGKEHCSVTRMRRSTGVLTPRR